MTTGSFLDSVAQDLRYGIRVLRRNTTFALVAILALALTRLLRTRLFGVQPTDLATFLIAPLVLGIVALLAAALPARRAARVDPVVALRYE